MFFRRAVAARLQGSGFEIHLIGTAHVSKESCDEVERIIQDKWPSVVCVELCAQRAGLMNKLPVATASASAAAAQLARGVNPFVVLHCHMANSIAERLGVVPGQEFFIARREADKCGANLKMIDRPIQITLLRAWRALSAWEKTKFIWLALRDLVTADYDEIQNLIEELKKTSNSDLFSEMFRELAASIPNLLRAVITERDTYMCMGLRLIAQAQEARTAGSGVVAVSSIDNKLRSSGYPPCILVAVVGAGHLQGIVKSWSRVNQMEKAELDREFRALSAVPPYTWKQWVVDKTIRWTVVNFVKTTLAGTALVLYVGAKSLLRRSLVPWGAPDGVD